MKGFDDKAEEAIPCVRVAEADTTTYRVTKSGLLPASEVGTDEFPQYGDWLPCTATTADGDDLGDRYLECPGALAAELVRIDADVGTQFRITEASKTPDDQWTITIERLGAEDV